MEADLALRPVVCIVLQLGEAEKFSQVRGFENFIVMCACKLAHLKLDNTLYLFNLSSSNSDVPTRVL